MVISHETNRRGRDFEAGQKTSFLLKAEMPSELWFYICPQAAGVKQRTGEQTPARRRCLHKACPSL